MVFRLFVPSGFPSRRVVLGVFDVSASTSDAFDDYDCNDEDDNDDDHDLFLFRSLRHYFVPPFLFVMVFHDASSK